MNNQILVVEDDPLNMMCMKEFLRILRIPCLTAVTGEAALDIMTGETVTGMLLDINLGAGMTGIDLVKTFRREARFKTLPIIAVSAYYSDSDHDELLEAGFTDYLSKPFTFGQLKAMLSRHNLLEG